MQWRCGPATFDLSRRVLVMGVLNVTPDSFSDGGEFVESAAAVARGIEMLGEGADLIDVGGESTRPGADPVATDEELRRVIPVIEGLRDAMADRGRAAGLGADPGGDPLRPPPVVSPVISIDTYKYEVAEAALAAGATVVNDITALGHEPRIAELVARTGAGLVLMHILGTPLTMQADPVYEDVVAEIRDYLLEREALALEAGVEREQIAFDPGIGFGKTLEHNIEIHRRMDELVALGRPLLAGPSRKSFIRKILAGPPSRSGEAGDTIDPSDVSLEEVIDGTAGAVAVAVARGARIVRVHDVAMMSRVVAVASRLR